MTTNNVTRFLDSKKVKYKAFDLPAEKLGAIESALLLNVPASQVFKSIVVLRTRPGKPILAIVPGDHEVDLKLLAEAAGEKKLQVSTQAEAEKLTGLQTGGISPLALINRGFQMWLDSSASNFEEIHISGGQRGLNIRLPVKDLLILTGARLALISHAESRE
ncbi:Cys-tRNA(Pro)/Cys-tRNA(Cys) deacylase [Leptolinea sp. HRD-7]|jgi:Cys-tRNA(Pro)/Cys-tRNA(Cys) deacylase|nr:Cys-tRNA(Pro)/Cys-tRNA(Cys) deacylase [Leptolinea sp. HRD-7]